MTLYVGILFKQLVFWEGDKNSSVVNILDVEKISAVSFNETNYVPVIEIVDTRNY